MIVPEAANMPPTPCQTEILAPGIWAGAVPRAWRTLSLQRFPPPRLNGRCPFSWPTPAETSGERKDASIPDFASRPEIRWLAC
jgi:hypothetical protein